jgi:hypothetical protein
VEVYFKRFGGKQKVVYAMVPENTAARRALEFSKHKHKSTE